MRENPVHGVAQYLKDQAKRAEPPLWVERVVLFSEVGDSMETSQVIREIPLKRGLNLVWGKNVAAIRKETGRSVPMGGHDVGKTSFCRLLRHLLGERTYGTLEQHKLIAKSFRGGYVGGEAWLHGKRWAILRPISRGTVSFAGEGMSLDELLGDRGEHRQFEEWRKALGNGLTSQVLGFLPDEAADPSSRWLRMLQWCSRDERAKYSHIWNWRESDQNNEPGAYQRPAVDGERLVRGTLGLNDDEGAACDREIDDLTKRIEKLKEENERALLEPKFWAEEYERWLNEKLTTSGIGQAASVEMGFVALEQKWEREAAAWRRQTAELRAQYNEIVAHLKRRGVEVQQEQEKLAEPSDVEEALAPLIDDEPGEADKAKDLLARLEEAEREDCSFGGIPYSRCRYIKWNKARKKDVASGRVIDPQDEAETKALSDRRRAATERTAERNERLEELDRKWTTDREEAEARLNGLRPIITRATEKAEGIEVSLELLRRTRDGWSMVVKQSTGELPFPKSAALAKQLESAKAELTELVKKRKSRLKTFESNKRALQHLYDLLAKESLSDIHEGYVELQPDKIEFRIMRKVEELGGQVAYRGNAAMTLSVVLADVAAMITSITGFGLHPAFLLHDSPRQGDLDAEHYRRYLLLMKEISDALGGEQSAPFQYVVTTTTEPPDDLRALTRLTLEQSDTDKLLFKRIIGTGGPPEPEQSDMFEGELG